MKKMSLEEYAKPADRAIAAAGAKVKPDIDCQERTD